MMEKTLVIEARLATTVRALTLFALDKLANVSIHRENVFGSYKQEL